MLYISLLLPGAQVSNLKNFSCESPSFNTRGPHVPGTVPHCIYYTQGSWAYKNDWHHSFLPWNLILRKSIRGPGNWSNSSIGKSKGHALLILWTASPLPTHTQWFKIDAQQLFVKSIISDLSGMSICMCVRVREQNLSWSVPKVDSESHRLLSPSQSAEVCTRNEDGF